MKWSAEHKSGSELAADGLTKALQGQGYAKFLRLVGMVNCTEFQRSNPHVASMTVASNNRSLQAAAVACTLAGVALMTEDWLVASLVVLAGCVVRKVVGRAMQGRQDPQKDRYKTLQKESQNSGEEEGTLVDVDQSGLVPLNAGAGKLQVGKDPKCSVGITRSSIPGIRALRAGPNSHGSDISGAQQSASSSSTGAVRAATQGRAAARGRDAMTWYDRHRGTNESLEHDIQQAETVDINEITEMLQGVTLQSGRENLQGDCNCDANQATDRGAASSSTAPIEAVASNDQPWHRRQFRSITTSSRDRWNLMLQSEGWYVREHRHHRKQKFHPIHSSTPFDCSTLEDRRITVKVNPRYEVEVDTWTVPTRDRAADNWVGFTFFKQKLGSSAVAKSAGLQKDSSTVTDDSASDGSFEMIGS